MSDSLDELRSALGSGYRLDRELGRGGMATVYRADDLRHGRTVAIKVMKRDLSSAVGAERFLREVRIASRLQHPHVLPLFESGEAAGRLYYVMPYVEGESLRQRLEREIQLPLDDALRIAREVASALEYAHRQGVVHRDIKPENLLLSDGFAVLADFGVARAVSEAGADRLTQSGLAMGSPQYMAPEQMDGDDRVDGRTDLYSLGCLLYEMLAGAPPFTGPTARIVLARHANDPVPPLETARPGLPDGVQAVVLKLLAKVPADRYADATEAVQALRRVAGAPAPDPDLAPVTATGQQRIPDTAATAVPEPERTFFDELKRRGVYQAAVVYGAVAYGLVQAADWVFPTFGVGWAFDYMVMAALLGFPLTIAMAWAYDLTRHGLRRATPAGVRIPTDQLTTTAAHRRRMHRVAVAVGGLAIFVGLFPFAFAATRVPVDVSRLESRIAVRDFLRSQGAAGQFKETAVLRRNEPRLIFLQRALGIEGARESVADGFVWDWHHRWYGSEETEEWQAAVGPGGRVVEFRHVQPEAAPGASLEESEAREVAHAFLAAQGLDPDRLEPVRSSSQRRANRTDYSFDWHVPASRVSWRDNGDEAGQEAVTLVSVDVHGALVGGFSTRFDLPESFNRENRRIVAVRGSVAGIFFGGLWLGALALVILGIRLGRLTVRWRFVLMLGLVGGVAGSLSFFLELPHAKFTYATETPYAWFLVGQVGWAVLGVIVLFILIGVLAAAVDGLGRLVLPGRMVGWDSLAAGRFRSPELATDAGNGLILGCLFLGIDALTRATQAYLPGVWWAVNWDGAGQLDTLAPWLSAPVDGVLFGATGLALLMGTAMLILLRYTGSMAVAVVLPAALFGFAAPAFQPAYLGGVMSALAMGATTAGFALFGPVALGMGLYLAALVPVALTYLTTDLAPAGTGILVMALAVLPLAPMILARTDGEDAEPAG